MKRRVPLSLLCALVLVALSISSWRVMGASRVAIAAQVRAGEELAASERALAFGQALSSASGRLEQLAGRAGRLAEMSEEDQLTIGLEILMAQPGAVGAAVVSTAGVPLAFAGDAPALPPADAAVFRAMEPGRGATVVMRAPVRMPGAEGTSAYAIQELLLDELVPGFAQPFAAFEGATSLVRRDGSIVMSTATDGPARVQSEEMLALVATGDAGYLEYWSPRFDSHRVGVTHPVAGSDLVVVVSADARSVAEPASALVRELGLVLIVTAVVVGGLVAGVVAIGRRSRRRLADQAALAMVDPMTGLTNRRGLDAVTSELGGAAVIAVDVDHLKRRNDTEGHASGDRAIVLVAHALRSAVRGDDVVARVGGDEFIVVMPGADRERAEHAVRAARQALAEYGVSVSAGIALAPAGAIADALAGADDELYVAKRNRDVVVLT